MTQAAPPLRESECDHKGLGAYWCESCQPTLQTLAKHLSEARVLLGLYRLKRSVDGMNFRPWESSIHRFMDEELAAKGEPTFSLVATREQVRKLGMHDGTRPTTKLKLKRCTFPGCSRFLSGADRCSRHDDEST